MFTDWMSISPYALAAFPFFFAVGLLDAFDISLPRGDTLGVSGEICGVALVLTGPVTAMVICVIPLAILELVRRRSGPETAIAALFVRSMAAGTALLCGMAVSSSDAATWVRSLTIPVAFLAAELVLVQVTTVTRAGRPLGRLIAANLRSQSSLIAAQVSAAALIIVSYMHILCTNGTQVGSFQHCQRVAQGAAGFPD